MNIRLPDIGFQSGDCFHWIKNLYLRLRYGAGCCDVFSLDYYLAKKIIKPLKLFKEKTHSYPCDEKISSMEDWKKIIDEMIWAFEYILNDEGWNEKLSDRQRNKNFKREVKGLKLFGEYFRSLWI